MLGTTRLGGELVCGRRVYAPVDDNSPEWRRSLLMHGAPRDEAGARTPPLRFLAELAASGRRRMPTVERSPARARPRHRVRRGKLSRSSTLLNDDAHPRGRSKWRRRPRDAPTPHSTRRRRADAIAREAGIPPRPRGGTNPLRRLRPRKAPAHDAAVPTPIVVNFL